MTGKRKGEAERASTATTIISTPRYVPMPVPPHAVMPRKSLAASAAVFMLLMPWGGEVRIKSDTGQAFGLMALILLFILGAIFALGLK
jgi:hypothetical protein